MKKKVFVTGGSGNVGKAVIENLVRKGHRVLATVSPGHDLGYSVTEGCETFETDLTNERSVQATFERIGQQQSTLDAAVLTVGGFATGDIESTDGAQLQRMFTMNFLTTYFCVRPLLHQMKTQASGRIILVGAKPGLPGARAKDTVAYALSKTLVYRLMEVINEEAVGTDIVCSVIIPGTIDTPANRSASPQADFSTWITPEQVAEGVEFLLSDAAAPLREPVLKMYARS